MAMPNLKTLFLGLLQFTHFILDNIQFYSARKVKIIVTKILISYNL